MSINKRLIIKMSTVTAQEPLTVLIMNYKL
jgi:hypothetical protein